MSKLKKRANRSRRTDALTNPNYKKATFCLKKMDKLTLKISKLIERQSSEGEKTNVNSYSSQIVFIVV